MTVRFKRRALAAACVAVFLIASTEFSLDAQSPAKRPLSYEVFDSWRAIGATRLSDDGMWLAYTLTSRADDGVLVVRNLQTGQDRQFERGTNPTFTSDGRYLVYLITPPGSTDDEEEEAEAEIAAEPARGRQGRGARGGNRDEGPRNSLGILTLASGAVTTIERVGTFRIPEESSTWLAYHRGTGGGGAVGRGGRGGRGRGGRGGGRQGGGQAGGARQQGKQPGQDLILRNLPSGEETTIGEVTEYAWNASGSMLAYTVSSETAANDGAYVRNMAGGTTTTLLSGAGRYRQLVVADDGEQLAFLSDQAEYSADEEAPEPPSRVYHWRTGGRAAAEVLSASTAGVPAGMVVADGRPSFSDDGARLFVDTRPAPEPEDPDAPDAIAVDIWHYQDPWIQPMQTVRANQERNRSYAGVVHLSNKKFVQLATPDLPSVSTGQDANRAVGNSDVPYRMEVSWDTTYRDQYVVDFKTGRRTKVLEHHSGNASLSPAGKYVVYFDQSEGDWFTYRISDGRRVNITERLGVNVWREDHDSPSLPGAYGTAGWTADDESILVYDKFDIWEVQPDGRNPRLVTNGYGREHGLVFRYTTLAADEDVIPTDRPLRLSTTNDRTKADGFYRVAYAANSTPVEIMMVDKNVGGVTKAANADRVVFTMSRFDEFPDLWVSDTNFGSPTKVSDANPQQAEFIWGQAELIDYINADGKTLRAIVHKPENFDPSRKYPLMVYIYEELTNGLHNYRAPNVGTSINITRYVSNGYIVLQPDIVYDDGFPGESAEKCVIPAVNTLVAEGYIDPARIGIQGHSWGGYQITHLISRTDMFAAVEAGASVVNMFSAYGGIRWGTGMSRAFQYERTQSRIGEPPWDAPLEFIENSPLFWIEKIHTPYLTIHNDQDDAVPWYQGIEFINAMRRLGKEAYMFNYNGEPHGLRNRDNQKHWTVHMDEFFDHYLLGKPKPDWMEHGVPYLQRGTRDVLKLFEKPDDPAPAGGGR